jgi:hypothetical protein
MLRSTLRSTLGLVRSLATLEARLERLQVAVGRIEQRLQGQGGFNSHEFSVFSQWGEDGLLAYLVSAIEIPNRVFVEFGVENYQEANTRFLATSCQWSGLVIDGSAEYVAAIRADPHAWRYAITAKQAFVTAENIDELIRGAGIAGDIGLLSIDIDGNDYWVWKAISVIQPRIVVVEYNSLFGARHAVTVPYQPEFVRTTAHSSNLYYGASASALAALGRAKGYALVGGNLAGNNLFFVRGDVLGPLRGIDVTQAYRPACFRESRDPSGVLTFLAPGPSLELIRQLPVVEVETGATRPIGEIFKSS